MNCDQIAEVEESYLLRELEAPEMRQIEHHLARCPQCARRMAGYEDLLGRMFAALEPVAPSPAVRTALMAKISTAPAVRPLAATPPLDPETLPVRRRWNFKLAFNLAAALVVALSGLSLFLAAQLQNHGSELPGSLQFAGTRTVETQALLELTTSPDSLIWAMSSPDGPGGPTAPRARMYVRASSDLYLITATNMPPPPPGYYYKAWYIHGSTTEFAGGLSPLGDGNYSLIVNDPTRSGVQITSCFINIEAKDSSLSQPTAPPYLQWNRA